MKNKKMMPVIGAIVAILVVAVGAFAYTKMRGQQGTPQEEQKKKKVAEPVNVLSVDQRPYLQIVPKDSHNLILRAVSLKKPATSVEYELEYQAGTLLQGAFGALELGTLPAETTILLGSCSAGGACTYHEDVRGGTLLTRFEGPENYALKSDWRYFDNVAKESSVASKDAKFQLNSADLKTQRYLIVFNTAGYPEGLKGTPVSDPYSLTTASTLKGKGELTLRANEDGASKIMGWDGKTWKEFETKVDGKTMTATVDLMELYIAVK
jgi:hypothetical protein